MSKEHIPSHRELIELHEEERKFYAVKFKQTIGVILILVLAFIVVKIISVQDRK